MRKITAVILSIMTSIIMFVTVYMTYLETGWAIAAGLFSLLFFYGIWKALLDITKISKALHRPVHLFEGFVFGFLVYWLYANKMAKVKGFETESYLIVMGVFLALGLLLSFTDRVEGESGWFGYFFGTLLYTFTALLIVELPVFIFSVKIFDPYQDIFDCGILLLGALRLISVTFFRKSSDRDDDDDDYEEYDEDDYDEDELYLEDGEYEDEEEYEDYYDEDEEISGFSFFSDCDNLEELNARYKNLCRTYHPDSKGGNDGVFKAMCEEYETVKAKLM